MAEVELTKDAPEKTQDEAQNGPKTESEPAPSKPKPEMQTMRCVRLTGHGGYSKLKVDKQARPKATEGHVVVKVHACGLNFADLMQRQGSFESPKTPFTPGFECSGIVEEIGENVTGIEVGTRVCCLPSYGAWAEYIAVPFTSCYVMPESMSFEEGAAFIVTYLTAYLMLFHCGNLGKRKSVLIHIAAGGVGTAATQLCKTVEGVTIYGTASAAKHEMIKELGVDYPIDYRTQDYVAAIKEKTSGVDLILDPLSGHDTKKCYDLLNPLGVLICFGSSNQISESKSMFSAAKNWFQGVATFNPVKMIADTKTVCGFALRKVLVYQELIQDAMKDLMKMYNDGSLKPCIDSVFALEEVAKAQQKMHERKNIGKIILSPLKEPEPEPEPEPKKKKKNGSKLEAEQKPTNAKEDKAEQENQGDSKQPKQEETAPSKEEEKRAEESAPLKQEEKTVEEPAAATEEEKTVGESAPLKQEEKTIGESAPLKQEEKTVGESAPLKQEEKTVEEAAAATEEEKTVEEPAAAKEEKTAQEPAPLKEEEKEVSPPEEANKEEASSPSSEEVKDEPKADETKKDDASDPTPSTEGEEKPAESEEQDTEM